MKTSLQMAPAALENATAPPLAAGAHHILVVDDDQELREHIASYLQAYGFAVDQAGNGREVDEALATQRYAVIVLDVMLPGEDGLHICRRLARQSGLGILMLSAAGEEIDRVLGLELGADVYLAKPCSPRELLANIRALLRRRAEGEAPSLEAQSCRFSGFAVDFDRRQLTAPNGFAILLSATEFALLRVLLQHPRKIVPREQLAEAVRQGDGAVVERSVDVLVSRLRRKLNGNSDQELIRTYRGEGYMLNSAVS